MILFLSRHGEWSFQQSHENSTTGMRNDDPLRYDSLHYPMPEINTKSSIPPIIFFFGGLLVLLLAVSCTGPQPPSSCDDPLGCVHLGPDEPLLIAVVQVMSGDNAEMGLDQLRAIELAVSERSGNLLGRSVKLMPVDSLCSREGGTTAALRVVSEPKVAGVLGTSCSDAAVTAMEILSKAGLTMISASNTAPSLTRVDREPGADHWPGYFRTAQNDEVKALAAASFAFMTLKLRRAATINDGDPYTRGLTEAFAREFSKLSGEIVLEATLNKGDEDMQPLLSAVAMSNAELLFYPVFRPEGDLLTLQARAMSELQEVVLMSADGLFNESFLGSAGQAARGMYFVLPDRPRGAEYERFKDRYQKAFGMDPTSLYHAYARDAAGLLFRALESAAKAEDDGGVTIGRQKLRDAVAATRHMVGLSGVISCDRYGDCGTHPMQFIRIDDPDNEFDELRFQMIYRFDP